MTPEEAKRLGESWQQVINMIISTQAWARSINTAKHAKFTSHTTRDESTVIFTSGPLEGQILILS